MGPDPACHSRLGEGHRHVAWLAPLSHDSCCPWASLLSALAPANDVVQSSERPSGCVRVISLFASFDDGRALTCQKSISLCVFEICVRFWQACADVRAATVFWQQMEIYDQLSGQPTIPEWLSTHPSHQNRVRQLDRLVPEVKHTKANTCIIGH